MNDIIEITSAYDDNMLDKYIKEIGRQIYINRVKRDWSVEHLSDRAGVSKINLYKIENGTARIGLMTLLKVSIALGVTVDELLPETNMREKTAVAQFRKITSGLSSECTNSIIEMVKTCVNLPKGDN